MDKKCFEGSNNLLKKLVRLKNKKAREEAGLFIVEGEKFVKDIGIDFEIAGFVFSKSFVNESNTAEYLSRNECYVFSDTDFAKISDTVTPQGILAVVKQKLYSLDDVLKKQAPFIIIGENVNDPGNIGTVIRTADACGCDAVIFSEQSADIYNPKAVRSAAGSLCHLPVIRGGSMTDIIRSIKQANIKIVAAHLKGETLPYDVDMRNGAAILIGNESNGLSENATDSADVLVKIPMLGKAESLNASIASGVLMYEVVRQRLADK